jgi:hypothetical protein
MSALDGHWLPVLDPATGMLALPLWVVGALAALFVVICVLAFDRAAMSRPVATVVRYGVVLIAALLAWVLIDRSAMREAAAERRALEARTTELTARAIAPGSALACLDASTGEAVERACEKALFATPEAVAAAVAYVNARLTLLADGMSYAKRADTAYVAQLAGLRRAAETDRFGLVAHVLATRDGCTAESCPTFELLEDTSQVSANLKESALDGYVARHAANWPKGEAFATASAPPVTASPPPVPSVTAAPVPVTSGAPVPNTYNFPSAASIPPVSIMTVETPNAAPPLAGAPPLAIAPAAPPAESVGQPPSPPRKPPQAAAQPPKKQAPPPAAPPRAQ